MKKIFYSLGVLTLVLSTVFFGSKAQATPTELLTTPWNFVINNGASEKYGPNVGNISSKISLTLTYNLHGTCILGGDASAIIFDQNGWKYISLSNYGQNCFDGQQVVTIPLSAFGLNLANSVGTFHSRFWKSGGPWTVDITSAILNDSTPPLQPTWGVQSVDEMKYTKDVICSQLTQAQIDAHIVKAKELGVTHVAIATPYTSVTCGSTTVDTLPYTMKWVSSIRAANLKVWHRHPGNKFEGIYGQSKHKSPDGYRHIKVITDFIALDQTNPTLIQSGDIFTPEAEPQNGGISGVTYCGNPSFCQFSSTADFNEWLRMATLATKLALQANDITDVKVGYWGFDGFLVWGNNNPDHLGTSKLEAATVAAMDNLITIDHYPSNGDSMATDLDEARAVWPTADFFIGEWGTIYGGSTTTLQTAVTEAFGAFAARSWIKGVNYWHLGPGGVGEALINFDMTNRPHFETVKSYFLHP